MIGQETLVDIEHMPFRPPRDGHEGEHIFLRLWQQLAKRAPEDFEQIFTHTLWFDQRMASVAASFVTWLGTSCGASFLRQMRESDERTAVAIFAQENRRTRWVNSGVRLIEYLLAPANRPIHGEGSFGQMHVHWANVPTATIQDLDAMECVARWLVSAQGRAFVQAAEAEIEAGRRNRYLFEPAAAGVAPADQPKGGK